MTDNNKKMEIKTTADMPGVERFIEEILDFYNIPGEYFGNILLAVTETIVLGMKGGRNVTMRIRKTATGISFDISRDEEPMNCLDELDKAMARQAIARETFIIRSLADLAELKDDGRTIELHFMISGIGLERTLRRSEKLKSYLSRKEKVMDRNE